MKKEYTTPEMDIVQFEAEDIITTSGDGFQLSDDELEILGIKLD